MSIAGIGSQGSGNLSQILSSLLTRLDSTSSTSTTDDTTTTQSTTTTTATDGGLTGSTKPSLSSMILGVLMDMQHQTSTESDTESSQSTSVSATDSTQSNPLSDLFTEMDTDSDGSVTQSELESYIESAGGTAEEADSLYSQLASDTSSGITEEDLASQAPPPPPPGGGPGGPGGPPPTDEEEDSTSSIGSELVDALDSDGDGTVSQSELTSYVTANGGTESDAETLFSSLVSDDESTLTASDFEKAVEQVTTSFSSNPYASVLTMLNAFTANTSSVSVSA